MPTRIVLNSRPVGAPTRNDFRLEEHRTAASRRPGFTAYHLPVTRSVYMRGRIDDTPSYAPPVALGDVMVGGTVSRVEVPHRFRLRSRRPGSRLLRLTDYALSEGSGLTTLAADVPHPSYALGVLGMPGFTAYMGLLDIGQPQESETVAVAAATGAVGSVVENKNAKLKGCRVVGIAGGADKCRYAIELGFDDSMTTTVPTLSTTTGRRLPQWH